MPSAPSPKTVEVVGRYTLHMPNVTPFTITRLRLRNYRSVKSCDLQLGNLSFLVGPNGSGKSNVVDSLRLISQALNENLDNALRQRGGNAEVRRRSNGHPAHFTIGIDAESRGAGMRYEFSIGSAKDKGYRVTREACRVRTSGFGSEDAFFVVQDGKIVDSSIASVIPKVQDDRLALVAFSGVEQFRPLFDGLTGVEVFSPSPDAMRLPQTPDPGDTLHRDASNIASVIGRIGSESPGTKARIEEYLRAIVPGIHSVKREAAGAWETLTFQQEVKGAVHAWQFPATSVSDGTLRALAVLTAMLDTSGASPSPIAVEEPETALHPAAAGVLLETIRDASESRQILVTSHSPDLLDSESIRPYEILAVRSTQGTTHVGRPDAAAQTALKENLFSAGDLLRTDQLQPGDSDSQQVLI